MQNVQESTVILKGLQLREREMECIGSNKGSQYEMKGSVLVYLLLCPIKAPILTFTNK